MCYEIGTGKTKLDAASDSEKFLYLRRTGVEAETSTSVEASPFKNYNQKEGTEVKSAFSSKMKIGTFYIEDADENKNVIGYSAALSTFANLRGVDFSDVSFILFDECIPENKNKHVLKTEGLLLLNMLETINRNRALEGRAEVVLCMLSNPIDLASPLLSQLGFTPVLNNLIMKNQQKYTDRNRSLHIEKLTDHIVSKDKGEKSVLYKFSKGTGFNEQSLSGDFTENDLSLIRSPKNLSEFTCEYSLENIYIYRHKSEESYYISTIRNDPRIRFHVHEAEKFRQAFYWKYKLLVVDRRVTYDNFNTKVVFESMIKYKPF